MSEELFNIPIDQSAPDAYSTFMAFWNAYPPKYATGYERNMAQSQWHHSGASENVEVVMKALELWKRSELWNKDNGDWIHKPTNFLKKEIWKQKPPRIGRPTIYIAPAVLPEARAKAAQEYADFATKAMERGREERRKLAEKQLQDEAILKGRK